MFFVFFVNLFIIFLYVCEKYRSMKRKVFISHASEDKKVVSLFVDKILRAGCDIKYEDIVFTSREDTGVVNGEDIPESIKDGIRDSAIFFMMVSEYYRRSEVCLNEMGAAWMVEDLARKILILPHADFDKIGWLMSLKKGTKLDDKDGLDGIRDDVQNLLGGHTQTVTWNRSKEEFLSELRKMKETSPNAPESLAIVPVPVEEEEEIDLLDMREQFDENVAAYTMALRTLSSATEEYNDKVSVMTKRLNVLHDNPESFSAAQVRGILQNGTKDTNHLAEVYEQQAPLLRKHFDLAMKYAILMQGSDLDEGVKADNRKHSKDLIDTLLGTRDEISSFRKILDGFANLDKGYKKAIDRLKRALDGILEGVSFCISRANDYRMA